MITMIRAQYSVQPKRISYMPLPNGLADIRLCINIRETEDSDGNAYWECDENYFRADMTEKYVVQHFDELLDYVPPVPEPEPTTEERIAALEKENTMLLECVLEMSEILYA